MPGKNVLSHTNSRPPSSEWSVAEMTQRHALLQWQVFAPPYLNKPTPEIQNEIREKLQNTVTRPDIGFFRLQEQLPLLELCQQTYHQFRSKKHFVHVGMGGSSLGPEVIIHAFAHKKNNRTFHFFNNLDNDWLSQKFSELVLENTLFYIVSKSGTTLETLAMLTIITDKLEQESSLRHFNRDQLLKNFFVICSDPKNSELLNLATSKNIAFLPLPSNLGGRYSVLSPCGFFPMLFHDLNIDLMLEGAKQCQSFFLENIPTLACWILQAYQKNINQTVMMPYSGLLQKFSSWFVQLWAESLGKQTDQNDFVGLTPISAYGPADQHSQLQLFLQGPPDKFTFFISILKSHTQLNLQLASHWENATLQKLAPFNLSQIIDAQLQGTMAAMQQSARPFVHFSIPELNEATLGALFLLFETLTVAVGLGLKIDPFDQPGVELGKQLAWKFLQTGISPLLK